MANATCRDKKERQQEEGEQKQKNKLTITQEGGKHKRKFQKGQSSLSLKSSESSNINRIEKNPAYQTEDMLYVLREFMLGGENSSQMTKHRSIRRGCILMFLQWKQIGTTFLEINLIYDKHTQSTGTLFQQSHLNFSNPKKSTRFKVRILGSQAIHNPVSNNGKIL